MKTASFQNLSLDTLELLAQQFPDVAAASREIIHLKAILNLPKGTEHFVSDIHGEHQAFLHVLKNGSGVIRRKINDVFGRSLDEAEQRELATLIYYPQEKLALLLPRLGAAADSWLRKTLYRLVTLTRVLASKYTRSKVRKALPPAFAYILEELLHEQESVPDKQQYYDAILDSILETGRGSDFLTAAAELIQRLAVDRLHVIGDVYDRGPGAHLILDRLMAHPNLDFQWGNHDLSWMGAAAGCPALVANVIRIALRYATLGTLEDGYALSLMPLATFALETYGDDPCEAFGPKSGGDRSPSEAELRLMARMHKAIFVIQMKLEGQILERRPHFGLRERLFLHSLNTSAGTVEIEGQTWNLSDRHWPTIDPADPYRLSPGEQAVIDKLGASFRNSQKLQQHARFLWSHGGLYLAFNGNLLYHGCIPLDEAGNFACWHDADGSCYQGRELLDRFEQLARQGAAHIDPEARLYGQDILWYLWTGPLSPVFGKAKMATFERYVNTDPASHHEPKNPYFRYRDQPETARKILSEFGLDPDQGRIVNGHVPVKVVKGESPIKAGGRLLVIDGGFSKAYQKETGLAGYTLIYNSYGFLLASHLAFTSTQQALEADEDLVTKTEIVEANRARQRIADTDVGRQLQRRIDQLTVLLAAYRQGRLKEQGL